MQILYLFCASLWSCWALTCAVLTWRTRWANVNLLRTCEVLSMELHMILSVTFMITFYSKAMWQCILGSVPNDRSDMRDHMPMFCCSPKALESPDLTESGIWIPATSRLQIYLEARFWIWNHFLKKKIFFKSLKADNIISIIHKSE